MNCHYNTIQCIIWDCSGGVSNKSRFIIGPYKSSHYWLQSGCTNCGYCGSTYQALYWKTHSTCYGIRPSRAIISGNEYKVIKYTTNGGYKLDKIIFQFRRIKGKRLDHTDAYFVGEFNAYKSFLLDGHEMVKLL